MVKKPSGWSSRMIVIGLSVNTEEEYRTAMKQAGGVNLLTKDAAVDELYLAIPLIQSTPAKELHTSFGGLVILRQTP